MPQVNAGQRVTAGVLSEDYALSDTSTFTVTASSATDLSKAWGIPAGDAGAGTVYRISARGNGTWGSTPQSLQFLSSFGGSTSNGIWPNVGSTQFSASATFRWSLVMTATCYLSGASATWELDMFGSVSQTANNVLSATGANGSIGFAGGTSTTFVKDSTAGITFKLQASWASVTGSPSIASRSSVFERLGG